MSASAYRYQPAPDRNLALRAQIVALAQRHRRYGSGMLYLKLRQSGMIVNHKRVERLYAQEKLQVRRRKRKKVLVAQRQPLGRPSVANQVWSMDFVFDRTAEGRVIKNHFLDVRLRELTLLLFVRLRGVAVRLSRVASMRSGIASRRPASVRNRRSDP